MCSTRLAENVDTSEDPAESESSEYVNRIDEIADFMILINEPKLGKSIPNEFYNEESKYSNDQIINEDGKVWSKEEFLTTWNSNYIKTVTSGDFNAENHSRVPIFSKLGEKYRLNKMKVEEVMEDSHLIRDENNHIQNENMESTMSRVGDVSEMNSSIQQEGIIPEKCDLPTSMESVQTETSEDINANAESKYIINQIIDENGKVWPKEDFLTSWNFHSIKMEDSKDLNSKTETTKGNKKDVNELLSSITMERSPPKCKFPKNMEHSKRKNHKCHSCDYSSPVKASLQNHINAAHLKLKNHECNICDYRSSCQADIQKHTNAVHLKLKNHKCNLCDYSSPQKGHLRHHIEVAHLKLENYKCNICDYSSWWRYKIRTHLESVHLKLKNFKCNSCDYRSSYKTALRSHIEAIHLKVKNHKCSLCDYSSSYKCSIVSHIKAVHWKLKNHKCNSCDYSSLHRRCVEKHINAIHLKLKNYKCNLCDYSSSEKGHLQRHKNVVHSKLIKS